MGSRPQKALVLIVARELAVNLATPMSLIDVADDLVFYNEAAEQILGKSFAELGTINPLTWGEMLDLTTPEELAAAVTHQGPTVGCRITDGDGSLCYLPDHEPSLGVRLADLEPDWTSGFSLAHHLDGLRTAAAAMLGRGDDAMRLAYEGMHVTLGNDTAR